MTIEDVHGPLSRAVAAQYAQAGRAGDLLVTGGVGPFGARVSLVGAGGEAHIRRTLDTIHTMSGSFGSRLGNFVSMNVLVSGAAAHEAFLAVRPEYFPVPAPASTAVGAGRLPLQGLRIEINAVARRGTSRVSWSEGGASSRDAPGHRALGAEAEPSPSQKGHAIHRQVSLPISEVPEATQ